MKSIKYLLMFLLFITSCSTTKYVEVPVETIKKEYIVDIKHDSIHVQDSIFIKSLNDTIYMEKWHTKYISKLKVDTIIHKDTIPTIVYIDKEVKVNELNWYQETLIYIGLLCVIFLIIKLLKFKYK